DSEPGSGQTAACGRCRSAGVLAYWASGGPPWVRCSQRLDQPGGDELAERGLGYADVASLAVLAQADEADTPLGHEAPGNALGGAKQLGGLGNGEQPIILRQRRPLPSRLSRRADLRAAGLASREGQRTGGLARRNAIGRERACYPMRGRV